MSWRLSPTLTVPLFFTELDKAGTCNTRERLDLLEQFDQTFGLTRIKTLIADREFIGQQWIQTLCLKKIPFFIRIKDNMQVSFGSEDCAIKEFFTHLNPHTARLIEKDKYGGTLRFSGILSAQKEQVIVMTNTKKSAKSILKTDRKRWSIEDMFRKLKSSGFQWEKTHMKRPERLVSLLIIMTLAMIIAYMAGKNHKIPFKKTIGYPLKSIFRHGLQIIKHSLKKGIKYLWRLIITLIKNAKNYSILFTDG